MGSGTRKMLCLRALNFALLINGAMFASEDALARAMDDGDLIHVVVGGDTLSGVAHEYLRDARDWVSIYRLNSLRNPNLLHVGQRLRLPAHLVRRKGLKLSVVGAKGAELSIGPERRLLRNGDVLVRGGTVVVGRSGFAQLQFEDGSFVRLGPDSELDLNELTEVGKAKSQRIELGLKRGRIDSAVKPRGQDGRFRISTPTAVAAVRGTEFGVTAFAARGTAVDVVEGSVAISRMGMKVERLLERNQGMLISQFDKTLLTQQLAPAPQLPEFPRLIEAEEYTFRLVSIRGGKYEVVVYSGDETPQVIHQGISASEELTIPGLPAGTFLVAVRAISDSGLASLPALARVQVVKPPEPPILLAPVDGAAVSIANDIELGCTEVGEVKDYVFQLDSEPSFGLNPEIFIRSACRLVFSPWQTGPTYWRVASRIPLGGELMLQGTFSSARRVDVEPRPVPPEVELVGVDAVTVTWPRRAGHSYRLEVALEPGFSNATVYPDTGSSVIQLSPLSCMDRYLRIRATDQHGVESELSSVHAVKRSPSLCSGYALPVRDASGQSVRSEVD